VRGLDGFCNNSNNCLKRFLQMQFSNKYSEDVWKYICFWTWPLGYFIFVSTPLKNQGNFLLDWTESGLQENERSKSCLYIILQQPVLSGGPTTSMLDAANFFRLLGLVLGWWRGSGRLRGSRELTARGSRVTPGSLRLLGEEVEEEGPWEPGFIITPSSSFCEASELFEVFKELEVLPATRFWDRVRFKSAKVPEGEV